MLIQMPRGSSDQPGSQNAEANDAFEAALRRDLASAPVISYEAMLGGWTKRIFDLTLTLFSAPVWLPLMLAAALVSKLRHPAPVFQTAECIGYGGREFKCWRLRVEPPSAVIERLHVGEDAESPANDWQTISVQAENRRAKWIRVLERLPQLLNVVVGDMALVGPSPLTGEQLEPLKTAKRYYLSARPGVIGISAIVEAEEEQASQYKAYALSWSLLTDLLILSDALRSLRDHGELWRPIRIGRPRPQQEGGEATPAVRRRGAAT